MSTPDDTDTGSAFAPVGSLSPDGTLEGRDGPSPPSHAEADEAPLELARPLRRPGQQTPPPGGFGGELTEAIPSAFQTSGEVELVHHVRRTDRDTPPPAFLTPPAPARSGRLRRVVVTLLVLLVVAGLGRSLWRWFEEGGTVEALQKEARSIQSEARALTQSAKHAAGFTQGTVLFLSTPDGATVTIDGEEIGVTPFAGDLRWRKGAEIVFTRRGYAPWTSTLPAGPEVKLDVPLKRAPSR